MPTIAADAAADIVDRAGCPCRQRVRRRGQDQRPPGQSYPDQGPGTGSRPAQVANCRRDLSAARASM